MSKFEVPVVRIRAIEPIEGADAIELAVVGDYRSVVKKNTYEVGDPAVYIPEGSIVPAWLITNLGLEGRLAGSDKNRVKAIKLRGCLSQGLLYPVAVTNYGGVAISVNGEWVGGDTGVEIGSNVAELLGVTKWEPPIPAYMSGEVCNIHGKTIAYDIENNKKYPDVLIEGELVTMTEKLHGCLHKDSHVMLPNGEEISIKNFIEKDYTHVLSYEPTSNKYLTRQVTGKMVRPNIEKKKWVRLEFENGKTLTLTTDHPVYSRDRKAWVNAGEIRVNEDIESPIM